MRSKIATVLLLSAATMAGMTVPTLSQGFGPAGAAQQKPMPQACADFAFPPPIGPHAGPDIDADIEPRGWPMAMGGHQPPPLPEFDLASKLATAEIYIGIKPAQLDAWRNYTTTLQDFLDAARPDHGMRPPRGTPAAAEQKDRVPPFLADMLADKTIALAEKAKVLKESLSSLRAALGPEQLIRLSNSERTLVPPGPPRPPKFGDAPDVMGPSDFADPRGAFERPCRAMSPQPPTPGDD